MVQVVVRAESTGERTNQVVALLAVDTGVRTAHVVVLAAVTGERTNHVVARVVATGVRTAHVVILERL